ncbi:unnamed protein product, partial [Linum tenue]
GDNETSSKSGETSHSQNVTSTAEPSGTIPCRKHKQSSKRFIWRDDDRAKKEEKINIRCKKLYDIYSRPLLRYSVSSSNSDPCNGNIMVPPIILCFLLIGI